MEVLNKEKVLEFAKQLIFEGKIDKAISEYKRLLDIDPKDMRIKIRIAELLAKQKKISDAVSAYKEVADTYKTDGFYLKAVTVYKNILRLNPALSDVNYELAELYEKMGLSKDAIHQYQILSNAMEQKGDIQGLVDVRTKIVTLDPHNVANRIRLAETFQYQGREDESIDTYEQLIDEVKGTGKNDQLIELYEKILSYRSDNVEMIRSVCELYYKRGEWKKIVSRLEKNSELFVSESGLILMLADVYTRLNQFETAKSKYKQAGEYFVKKGDVKNALKAYKEMFVIVPEEDEDVKELLDEIDTDLIASVMKDAEEKRLAMASHEAEEENASEDTGGDDVKKEEAKGGRPGFTPLTDNEVAEKKREADSAFELGKAYYQMSLKSEMEEELKKALSIYKTLIANRLIDEKISEHIDYIEKILGQCTVHSEQCAGDKEQGGDNRQQTEDQKQKTNIDNRQQNADNRPKTEDQRPKTEDKRPKTKDRRPETERDEGRLMTHEGRSTKDEARSMTHEDDNKDKQKAKSEKKKKRDKRMGFV